ncbi:hypothetical protein METSCH_E06290 [Metschnikowia aff. pulcherrima]|uniref:Uncharacterized protein n=1 Tax=Metschnikowia aff. pulcherrima TaxID=2163413 RepID=A0A4P6XSA4_9ASCO|nr:hypothetical protein METSCH_E06290 [Metschnikowia aff. pulcherrima]
MAFFSDSFLARTSSNLPHFTQARHGGDMSFLFQVCTRVFRAMLNPANHNKRSYPLSATTSKFICSKLRNFSCGADPANTEFQTFAVPMRLAGVSQRHYVHGQYVETSVCTRSNATHKKINITMQARISNSRVRLLRQSNREIGPTMDIPCSFSDS